MTQLEKNGAGKPLRTDDLITALTADLATPQPAVGRALAIGCVVSVGLAALVMVTNDVAVRPGFVTLLSDARFAAKFVFTLAVLAAGVRLALRLSRPGVTAGPAVGGLLGVGLLAAVGVGMELMVTPAQGWLNALVGTGPMPCLTLIPLLAAAPLVVLLYALRAGAPDSPTLTGATAGLIASGIGATLYASHCPNDSPLYVATWYFVAMALVCAIGGAAGSRVLRW
jgi:hypothetical protein